MDPFQLQGGSLHCEDVPLAAHRATRSGRRSTSIRPRRCSAQARALQAALAPLGDPLIAFAVKANPNAAVLATLAAEGLGADVVSGGEYRRARAAGNRGGEDRLFRRRQDRRRRWRSRSTAGFASSTWNRSPKPRCCPRSRCRWDGRRRSASGSIPTSRPAPTRRSRPAPRTTSSASRSADAAEAYARARDLPGLEVSGVAVHIGSQLTSLAPLEAAFEKIGALIRRAAGGRARDLERRSRRRARRRLRSRRAAAADARGLRRDGRPGRRRLGRTADLRAGPADRRQCRRPARPG